MKRTFVGFDIIPDQYFMHQYNKIKAALREEKIAWANPGNFHVTLHFFGNMEDKDIRAVSKILDESVAGFSPIPVLVSGLGIFRSLSHPRVLWAGFQDSDKMKSLKEHFEKQLILQGFELDERPFRPHLTLGRMKRIKDPERIVAVSEEYKEIDFLNTTIQEVIFYESILSSEGSVYKRLSVHPL